MKVKQITISALMLSLIIICSYLTIPIGPVPISLQTFAVLLIGLLFPAKASFTILVLYCVLGLVGLPVFAGAQGGLQSILLPSFGFVLGFIVGAPTISFYLSRVKQTMSNYLIAAFMGQIIIYGIGLAYMAFILNTYLGNNYNLPLILSIGLTPFIPGDILKTGIAVLLAHRLKSIGLIRNFI